MPFIPHTENDVRRMLSTIGVESIDTLFDEIPDDLKCDVLHAIPQGMSEMEVSTLMHSRAAADGQPTCFIGAGAYDHHIPAAVWELATRGEFYTAYTPYQAEASQGTLQLLYEYQSMMTALTGMEVANASLYDGASAVAESILMAVRANRKSKSRRVLLPRALHPAYRRTADLIVRNQDIELIEIPFDMASGKTDLDALEQYSGEDITALIIPQPNFFGVLEDVDELTNWARNNGAFSIAVVNPTALAILRPPGQWGDDGVDICCGDGQPLGIPLSSGGPYLGFMCCKQKHVRQMPGRIIGATEDLDGKRGYSLTLQAREQHIRRSKATSNICTNQGLMVTAATIYMTLLGGEGLALTAAAAHANTEALVEQLCGIEGVDTLFDSPVFHERALKLNATPKNVLRSLAAHNLLGGYDLAADYPELGNTILVCATEKRTPGEIGDFRDKLDRIMNRQSTCPVTPKFDPV